MRCIILPAMVGLASLYPATLLAATLHVATFQADVTPPIGAPLCDALVQPADSIVDPLSARGIVILGAGEPIVLCAVDWVGIGNGGYDAWREALARAAGTTVDRVAVHCLHQHDAPGYDTDAEALLAQRGLSGKLFHVAFGREAIERVSRAVKGSLASPRRVTHAACGKGLVKEVASNRRVMGEDGKVKYVRYSACRDEKIRAEPEGTIDPYARLVAFCDGEAPVAVLTYYATHPQSYYGNGDVSCDFPGLARGMREKELSGPLHVHFNGAGGNVTAGKYNDGSRPMRDVLATRLAAGLKAAWEDAQKHKTPIEADHVSWRVVGVALPPRDLLDKEKLQRTLDDPNADERMRLRAARDLAFKLRCDAGHKIPLSCLRLGSTRVIHLPGELFVEYQLAAQKLYSGGEVCTAAYGDYGPGYIGTQIAYGQGGYETSHVSRTAPEVEQVLLNGIAELLEQ